MPRFIVRHMLFFLLVGDFVLINSIFFLFRRYFNAVGLSGFNEIMIINLFWLILAAISKLYSNSNLREAPDYFRSFTAFILAFDFFTGIFLYQQFGGRPGINFAFKYLLVSSAALGVWRILLLLFRRNYRLEHPSRRKSVLVGNPEFSNKILANTIITTSLELTGYYTTKEKKADAKNYGTLKDFFADLRAGKISTVVLCDESINAAIYDQIVAEAENHMARIYFAPNFRHIMSGSLLEMIQGIPLIKLLPEPLSNPWKMASKRLFDVAFSLLVIIFILSWMYPILAILISIESRGPVLFSQFRSGLNNETFRCFKFRSMRPNEYSQTAVTVKNDSRITKVGKFIRKTSIDELPQFFNVLLGDMSVVGPRPHILSQRDMYSGITQKYMLRHVIRPGITGWAQVMGSRGEITSPKDMQNRIEKDMYYIQNWSFFLDMKIIFLTIYKVFIGDKQAF